MFERIPEPPRIYSATIARSDGSSTKVYVSGARRRMDFYRNGQLERITVSHPDEGEIRTYRMQNRECLVTPMPSNFSGWSDEALDTEAVVTPERSEAMRELRCTRFRVTRDGRLAELRWYDERSGLCVKAQTFDAFGKPVLTVEWSDVSLEAPAESLFERLTGFRERKIRL